MYTNIKISYMYIIITCIVKLTLLRHLVYNTRTFLMEEYLYIGEEDEIQKKQCSSFVRRKN